MECTYQTRLKSYDWQGAGWSAQCTFQTWLIALIGRAAAHVKLFKHVHLVWLVLVFFGLSDDWFGLDLEG